MLFLTILNSILLIIIIYIIVVFKDWVEKDFFDLFNRLEKIRKQLFLIWRSKKSRDEMKKFDK